MPKSRTRPSKASGALAGALLFGASPAFAQMTVFDPWNYAIQGALKSLQQGMSSTLTSITNQLTATGPLGTLLGSAQYGSVTALLQQGFTQDGQLRQGASRRPKPGHRRRLDLQRALSSAISATHRSATNKR